MTIHESLNILQSLSFYTVDPCNETECVHGQCISYLNENQTEAIFTCECEPDFEGELCDEIIIQGMNLSTSMLLSKL